MLPVFSILSLVSSLIRLKRQFSFSENWRSLTSCDDADPDLCLFDPSGPARDAIIEEEVVDGDEVASVALPADALHRE